MDSWAFDYSVAKIFDQHAKQHIPHYESIIRKSVDVCNKLSRKDDPIIDVGCATGNTLNLLHHHGYTNVYGLDSSAAMLAQCRDSASLIQSDKFSFSNNSFQGIICNWTLHFIQNKSAYLTDLVNSLRPNGFLIVTDKVSLDPLMIDLYYDFKHSQGVTRSEILAKEHSLQNVMFINGPDWYQEKFTQLGLKYHVIDADYAFMTFLCIKQ